MVAGIRGCVLSNLIIQLTYLDDTHNEDTWEKFSRPGSGGRANAY